MSVVPKSGSEECSVIAFYGIDTSAEGAQCFYRAVVKWFNELGYPPDKIGIDGPGHGRKLGLFGRGDAKLKKTGFDQVTNIEFISSTPDALTGSHYYLTAGWSAKYSYCLIAGRSSIITMSDTSMLPIARTIAYDLKPEYGIGYEREHRFGPDLFAIGLNYSASVEDAVSKVAGEAYEESLKITHWGDAMAERLWQMGILRDVYPWNFLTQPQLSKQVGGISLREWVRLDARRGTVNPFCGDVFLWEVDEANLLFVRQALHQASIIFDWKKHL